MAKAKQAEAEAKEASEADGEGEATASKGWLSRKLIIMVAAGILVLGGGGGGAYVFFFAGKAHEEKAAPVAAKPPPAFFDLPEVLVNLQSPGNGRSSYLKAKIVLEVSDAKMVEQIKPLMPRVMDAFQTYLREMRSSDLEGSAGLYRLRDELTRRVNLAVAPTKVNAVLFKEIVVQ
jgi:flagellar FliL protein